jgi:hypothetical protein
VTSKTLRGEIEATDAGACDKIGEALRVEAA